MLSIIKRFFVKTSITSKMVVLTVLVGIAAWAVMDHIFTGEVRDVFMQQLHRDLQNRSQEAREDFNDYVRAHVQLVRLLAGQKRMTDYLETVEWFDKQNDPTVYYTTYPKWLLSRSAFRALALPRFVILYDTKRKAREVFHRSNDLPPKALLTFSELLFTKSHNQSHITSLEDVPYLISSDIISGPHGARAIVAIASPIDDEFLIFSQKSSPERLLALLSEDSSQIMTSNNLSLIPTGIRLDTLKDRFLFTGEKYYEYGDSEVVINLVSLLPMAKAHEMADEFVLNGRKQRVIMASTLILLSALIMYSITRRIEKLTGNISDFSKRVLGGKGANPARGDELTILENRFQLLFEEIISSQVIIRKDAEAMTLKRAEIQTKDRLYKLLQSVTDAMGIGVLLKNNDGLYAANKQMEYFQELCGSSSVFEIGNYAEMEKTISDKQGNSHVFQISCPELSTGENVILVRDVTEKKNLEDQLRQLQKMDVIGQLAGGMAHDFNNILNAIIGYADLLKEKISDETLSLFIKEILYSTKRGTSLIRSLLAFSRKQIINPGPVDLNTIVINVENLLSRLIGEDIMLKTILSEKMVIIHADLVQIEHVLMNLATNARDAMPNGGTLTIRVETVDLDLDKGFLHDNGYAASGRYAMLSILDTGIGMDQQTKEKIFEPFYTTKEVGKGSGLGLSMVYGVVRQHNGHIEVYSEPNAGALFEIYLPVLNAEEGHPEKPVEAVSYPGGVETVLLAEDDAAVRRLAKSTLEKHGYSVIDAVDGEDAIQKFVRNRNNIDILVTDVVMPKKNGKELFAEVRAIKPDVKALFISGYSADLLHKKGILEDKLHFMFKPLSADTLLNKIREVLDNRR